MRWRGGTPSQSTGFALEANRCSGSSSPTKAPGLTRWRHSAAARAWAEERNAGNLEAGRAFLAGAAEFQARAAPTMLVGAFLTDFYKLVADWADWASGQVTDWPDDPGAATPNWDEMRAIVSRAQWSETG